MSTTKIKMRETKPNRSKLKLSPGTVLLAQPDDPKNNFKCVRCTHEWQARKQGELPIRCPCCSSAAWNKAYARASGPHYRCCHCGHKWIAVKTGSPPKICPKCRSYGWQNPATLPSAKPPGVK